jgi:predicted phage tail protein
MTDNGMTDKTIYANATRSVIPIISVFMPPANSSRENVMLNAWAEMTCLRVSKFSKGSRVPPELPSPTSVHISVPLNKGAKAGIAVGAIVGVLLIAVALSFFIMRTRRRKASAGGSHGFDTNTGKEDNKHGVAQLLGDEKYEIVGDNKYTQELDPSLTRPEAGAPKELEGETHDHKGPPAELQG